MQNIFTATKKKIIGGLLPIGQWLCVVTAIIMEEATKACSKTTWLDPTPQIKVELRHESDGMITRWFNMQGYKNKSDFADGKAPKGHEFRSSANANGDSNDEQYLVNTKTNMRVVSDERTAECVRIFTDFANDAGISEDEDFGLSDLEGREVGVVVRGNGRTSSNGKEGVEVHYTCLAEKIVDEVEA